MLPVKSDGKGFSNFLAWALIDVDIFEDEDIAKHSKDTLVNFVDVLFCLFLKIFLVFDQKDIIMVSLYCPIVCGVGSYPGIPVENS
jgi:hypothetical protein